MGSKYEVTYWDYTQGVYSKCWEGNDKETALQKLDECAKEWYCVTLTFRGDKTGFDLKGGR